MLKPIAITGAAVFAVGVIGLVVFAVNGAGFPAGGLSTFAGDDGNLKGHAVNQTKTFDGTGLTDIQVDADAAAIHVSQSTGNQVQVHLYGQDSAAVADIVFDAGIQNHQLHVQVTHHTARIFGFVPGNLGLNVDVALPKAVYHQVELRTKAGAIQAVGIQAHAFDFESNAGATAANDLTGDLTARTNAGAIRVKNVTGILSLSTQAGEIVIEQRALKQNIDAQSNAGAIRITTDTQPAALQFDLETKVGRTSVELPNVKFDNQAANELRGSVGTGGPQIHAHTDVGAVSLNQG